MKIAKVELENANFTKFQHCYKVVALILNKEKFKWEYA